MYLKSSRSKKSSARRELLALRLRDHARELFVEAVTVVKPGQRVALGEINELLGGLPLVGHVFEKPQEADRPAVDVLDGVSLLGDEAAVGHLDLVGAVDLAGLRLTQYVPRLLLGPREQRRGGRNQLFGRAPDDPRAERHRPDAAERGIAVDDAVVVRDEQNSDVHRAQERRQPRMLVVRARQVLLLHRLRILELGHRRFHTLLGLLALGDVADADADAFVGAALAVDRAPVRRGPELGAVLAPRAKFVIAAGVAAQRGGSGASCGRRRPR